MESPTPPRPSPRIVAAVAVVCLALLVYGLLALGNPLMGLLPTVVAVGGYLCWRFLRALEAAADGLQRLAAVRERED